MSGSGYKGFIFVRSRKEEITQKHTCLIMTPPTVKCKASEDIFRPNEATLYILLCCRCC